MEAFGYSNNGRILLSLRATKGIDSKKSQEQYQMAVKSTLKEIASEAQEVGSKVNKWLTKT